MYPYIISPITPPWLFGISNFNCQLPGTSRDPRGFCSISKPQCGANESATSAAGDGLTGSSKKGWYLRMVDMFTSSTINMYLLIPPWMHRNINEYIYYIYIIYLYLYIYICFNISHHHPPLFHLWQVQALQKSRNTTSTSQRKCLAWPSWNLGPCQKLPSGNLT
jgi:hypothetical protein